MSHCWNSHVTAQFIGQLMRLCYLSHMIQSQTLTLVPSGVKGEFIYTHHTLCVQTARAMVSMRICACSLEPSLPDNAISNKDSYVLPKYHN